MNFLAGGLTVTGGADYIGDNLAYNIPSNVENFKFESSLKLTRGGSGVGLGDYCGNFVLATFGLSDTGENHIAGWWYSPIPVSAPYRINLDDSLHIVMERKYDTIYAMLENYTAHYKVSTGYRFQLTYPLWSNGMPNSGQFAMYFMGGSQTIYNMKLSSSDHRNTLCTFVGGTVCAGYFAGGMGRRYQDILYAGHPYSYATNAGLGDGIGNVANDTLEIISMHPKYVYLDIGVNDAYASTDTNVYETYYRKVVQSMQRHGITPVAATLTPQGVVNIIPYNNRIKAVATSEHINLVDVWSRLVDSTSTNMLAAYNSGDNTNPSPLGHWLTAQAIATDAPFLLNDLASWDSIHAVVETDAGHDKLFVMKYDTYGNFQWLRLDTTQTASNSSAGNSFSCGNSIALGDGDQIYVGGNVLVASYPAAGSIVNIQAAVLDKFNSSGTPLWQKQFGADAINSIQGVCTSGNGESYVIGNYGGYLNLGGSALTPADFSNIFMAKFDAQGDVLWSTNANGYAQFSSGIAIDRSDSTLAFVGNYNDSASFGPISVHTISAPSFTNYDAFIGRLSDRLLPTSISNINSPLTFSIYPNPSADLLNISLPEEGIFNIQVLNSLGQEYLMERDAHGLMHLDINSWEKGIYILHISDSKQHSNTCKFVKM